MFIQTESTPNPATIKFIPGRKVYENGTIEFNNQEEAKRSPLATTLFQIGGITNVFYGNDFISITKDENADWFALKPQILEQLVYYLTSHAIIDVHANSQSTPPVEHDAIAKEIQELLDTKVRPAVAMDGGDITFERFEDGVVYLKMKGACSGCPSSSITLKSGIENMLRYYIPEVTEVRAAE